MKMVKRSAMSRRLAATAVTLLVAAAIWLFLWSPGLFLTAVLMPVVLSVGLTPVIILILSMCIRRKLPKAARLRGAQARRHWERDQAMSHYGSLNAESRPARPLATRPVNLTRPPRRSTKSRRSRAFNLARMLTLFGWLLPREAKEWYELSVADLLRTRAKGVRFKGKWTRRWLNFAITARTLLIVVQALWQWFARPVIAIIEKFNRPKS